jgi:hypothetical protein
MFGNQHSVFYNCLGKFREPPVEGLFYKSDGGGANESLPFFVWGKWSFLDA